MKEKIICSAIHFDDNRDDYMHRPENISSGFVVAGLRHCNCFGAIQALSNYDYFESAKKIQGFITSLNRFVDRQEAAIIAKRARQIKKKTMYLFSEDLY